MIGPNTDGTYALVTRGYNDAGRDPGRHRDVALGRQTRGGVTIRGLRAPISAAM